MESDESGEASDSEEVVETATGKELGASKAVAKEVTAGKSVPLSGEIMGPDVITDIVFSIENLKEKDARSTVNRLIEQGEESYFKLGGVLSLIQVNHWYKPYPSLREFIESECGMEYRRAMYWVATYNYLVESKVPFAKVTGLGWTKLKEIAKVISPENVDHWVKIAKEQNTATLIETVRHSLAAAAGTSAAALEDGSSPITKTVTVMTFKVHEDQAANINAAIEKAKEEGSTQVATVALEYMCLSYLGGPTQKSLVEQIKGDGTDTALETALEALATAWPDYNFKVEAP